MLSKITVIFIKAWAVAFSSLKSHLLQRAVATATCMALCSLAVAQSASPAVPRFVEETDAAGLQSRFEGEAEFLVGGGLATFDRSEERRVGKEC